MRRKIFALLAPILLAGVMATPASADVEAWSEKCYDGLGNDANPNLPNKTDLNIYMPPCIHRSGNKLYASVKVAWGEATLPIFGSGHKFDGFKVFIGLERRPNGSSSDVIIEMRECDIKDEVNAVWSGDFTCKTPISNSYNSAYDYSADGWIQYDIDNDGESWKPIQYLTGSPLIK